MDAEKYEALKLSNQLCFPLYACAKEVVRRYRPYLDELELTYTQYIAMMVFWEEHSITVKALGERLHLDSGTLSPLLKKLEEKGYVKRQRSTDDERNLLVSLTELGNELRERAVDIPAKVGACISLSGEEAAQLYVLLYKLLDTLK